MLIISLGVLFLLPYTFANRLDPDIQLLNEHCAPLLHDGVCNLECYEEFLSSEDFDLQRMDQREGDCVLHPIETKLRNLTICFASVQTRAEADMEAVLVSIALEAKHLATNFNQEVKCIGFFIDVRASLTEQELASSIVMLKHEIHNHLGSTVSEALVDGFTPKKEESSTSIIPTILKVLAVFSVFFCVAGVAGAKRTRTSRLIKDIPVWTPPKEDQLGFPNFDKQSFLPYPAALMSQYNQQMQNYEQYLHYPTAAHNNQGYLTSTNFIQPPVQTTVIQKPTVLYTQACCGNISTPINPVELAVSVAGIFPIHAVLLRHSNRSITREEETRMIEDLKKILEAGGEINEKTCIERNGNPQKGIKDEETALMIAVVRGLYAVAEFLLEKGADQWEINKTNSICLHQAVQNMDVRMMKLLLEYHRKDPERDELIDGRPKLEGLDISSKTPLMYCAEAIPLYAMEMAKLLIEGGAALDSTDDKKDRSVVHYAAIYNNVTLLEYLIDLAGIKLLDTQDSDGCTPLMLAVEYGYTDVVEKLLNAGAPSKTSNIRNETPRDVAIQRNYLDIVELLDTKNKTLPSPPKNKTPRQDHGAPLGDVTNTFHTPPSSCDSNLNMVYTASFQAQLTPPDCVQTTVYGYSGHRSQLFV